MNRFAVLFTALSSLAAPAQAQIMPVIPVVAPVIVPILPIVQIRKYDPKMHMEPCCVFVRRKYRPEIAYYLKTHTRDARACNTNVGTFVLSQVEYKDGYTFSSDNLLFSCLSDLGRKK